MGRTQWYLSIALSAMSYRLTALLLTRVGESPSWLRHWILIPACEGSSPSSPAKMLRLGFSFGFLSGFFQASDDLSVTQSLEFSCRLHHPRISWFLPAMPILPWRRTLPNT
jgi:hypothetical protein